MIWRWIYAGATYLLTPLVFGYFAWRGRAEPGYRDHWRERLGHADPVGRRTLWLHAASVGEVILVIPLIEALIDRYPDHDILLTTFTPTGRAEALRRLGNRVRLAYLPLDTPAATRRFMQRRRPIAGILAETELWPNLVAAAEQAGVPLVLVNASLSARSAARYQRWPISALAHFMLARIQHIAAAENVHAERFMSAGAPASAVTVTGNLKYDRRENPAARRAAADLRARWRATQRPVWLAASTHASEEAQLIDTFTALRRHYPDLLWILAPRHPQRFDEVDALFRNRAWRRARRSRDDVVDEQTDIVLADTLGELELFYALADVAFVGGSLVPGVGGHNVIEPAAAACVFATGPHINEWRGAMAPMIEVGGAVIAEDPDSVAEFIRNWLDDAAARRAAGQRIAAIAVSHRGALARTLVILTELIDATR